MKKLSAIIFILFLFNLLSAQETVEISDLVVQQFETNLFTITVEVTNSTSREISEIAGYIDIYDNSNRIVKKEFVQIQHVHDIPLRPHESKSDSVVIDRRPNMSGTANYRITHLRFFGEQSVYMVCPNCGEIILKDE
jgi:ribosomal protein S17E